MLIHPEKKKKTEGDNKEVNDVNEHERDLHILIFRSVISSTEKAENEFMKQGSLSPVELDALVSALQLAGPNTSFINLKHSKTEQRGREGSVETSAIEKLITSLQSMGVRVYGVKESNVISASKDISWDNLAGYDLQKRQIEDTILLALLSPEIYDDIAHGTRCKFESNRPRAVLFEGPPGTGKTSSARIIANQVVALKQGCPVDSLTFNIMLVIVKKQIEDRLKSKGIQPGTYSKNTVSVKGQKVAVKFQIPPSCEAQQQLIANIDSNLWLKVDENGGGGSVSYRYWTSGVSCYLMIIHQEKKKTEGN